MFGWADWRRRGGKLPRRAPRRGLAAPPDRAPRERRTSPPWRRRISVPAGAARFGPIDTGRSAHANHALPARRAEDAASLRLPHCPPADGAGGLDWPSGMALRHYPPASKTATRPVKACARKNPPTGLSSGLAKAMPWGVLRALRPSDQAGRRTHRPHCD